MQSERSLACLLAGGSIFVMLILYWIPESTTHQNTGVLADQRAISGPSNERSLEPDRNLSTIQASVQLEKAPHFNWGEGSADALAVAMTRSTNISIDDDRIRHFKTTQYTVSVHVCADGTVLTRLAKLQLSGLQSLQYVLDLAFDHMRREGSGGLIACVLTSDAGDWGSTSHRQVLNLLNHPGIQIYYPVGCFGPN